VAIERHSRDQSKRNIAAATERERDLAPRVPDRRRWEAEHAPLRERAAALREELGARRERHVERALDEPSAEIRDALGEGALGDRPDDRAGRREWQAASRELDRAQRALGREREGTGTGWASASGRR